jgi:hypothetical protein
VISFHFRVENETPAHVTVGVFAGRRPGSRGKCGSLTFRVEEWPEFRDLLEIGAAMSGRVAEFSRLALREGGGWADEPLEPLEEPE